MAKREGYPRALGEDALGWIDFAAALRKASSYHADRQARTSRRLLRGLYADGVPGIILGDEVGMGKTFEAFGVIAAVLKHRPSARIAVLTHSRNMAREWMERWQLFVRGRAGGEGATRAAVAPRVAKDLPDASWLDGVHRLGAAGLVIGSYEAIKHVSHENMRAVLERALEGRYLRKDTKARLRWDALGCRARANGQLDGLREPSRGQLERIWKLYAPDTQAWVSAEGVRQELRRTLFRCSRTQKAIDLLVVDEAHKLASHRRQLFFEEVLGGRARRALYVSATPFALVVEDLLERIQDMFEATGADERPLERVKTVVHEFRDAIVARKEPGADLVQAVTTELGRYLVRSTWSEYFPGTTRKRRKVHALSAPPDSNSEDHATVALALERAFIALEKREIKTHRATHRETLCSSHSAIRKAAEKRNCPAAIKVAASILPSGESPKFQRAVEYLTEMALKGEKVVVFAKRTETISAMFRAIRKRTEPDLLRERAMWKRMQPLAAEMGDDRPHFRLAVYRAARRGSSVSRGSQHRLVAELKRLLTPDQRANERKEQWGATWGPSRHIEWVARLTGETKSSREDGKSFEDIRFAFNLPGPPYILICTSVAREGIDLHRWCRHILHYDLEWNPASLEQEVGRIDRIDSLSWRTKKPVEIVHVWQPGTYEERIAKAVEERLKMMRVLLGAGAWLAADPEDQEHFDSLEKYKLDLSP